MSEKDKIIIKALKPRFEAIQSPLFRDVITGEAKGLSTILKESGIVEEPEKYGIEEARAEFVDLVQSLADLPPPSPDKKDDVGFSASTDRHMRNWLFNEREGLNNYSSLYRAINTMKIHAKQLPEGSLQRIQKVVEPLAKKESKAYGTDLKGKNVERAKVRHKGKSFDKLSPTERLETILDQDRDISKWITYVWISPEGIEFQTKNLLASALEKVIVFDNLPIYIQKKQDASSEKTKLIRSFYVSWKDFTPTLLKKLKEIETKDGTKIDPKYYGSLDRLWSASFPQKEEISSYQPFDEFMADKIEKMKIKIAKDKKSLERTKVFIEYMKDVNDVIFKPEHVAISLNKNIERDLKDILKAGAKLPYTWKTINDRTYFIFPYTSFSPSLLKSIKDFRGKKTYFDYDRGREVEKSVYLSQKYYGSLDRLWSLISDQMTLLLEIAAKAKKAAQKKAEEEAKALAGLTPKEIIERIGKGLNSIAQIRVDKDNVLILTKQSGDCYALGQQTDKSIVKTRNIGGSFWQQIPINKLGEIQKLFSQKHSHRTNLSKDLQTLSEKLSVFKVAAKKEEKKKEKKISKAEKGLIAKENEGKTQLLTLSRYYEKLPDFDALQFGAIADIAKIIEEEKDIKDVVGISLIPLGSSAEEESKNYFTLSNKGKSLEGKKILTIPVPKEQAIKFFLFLDRNNKAKAALNVPDYNTSTKLRGNNVSGKTWTIDGEVVGNNWHKVGSASLLLNDWAIKLEDRYPLMAFSIRKWLDTNEDVLGKDCDPKLASLWGKGYFEDIEDKELVEDIKKSIPEDFEADGIVPSKELGGKPQKVKFKPYEYQKIGAYFAYKLKRAYIGDTMGLGKTIQGLLWLRLLSDDKDAYPALICAPASVVYNWVDECNRWLPNVSVSAYESGEKTQIRVISWGSLAIQEARILKYGYKSFMVDEAHYGKNGYKGGKLSSQRAKSFMKIGKKINNVLLLSGTPMENRVDELWSQIYAIKPEAYPNFKDFEVAYSPKKEIKLKNGMKIKVQDDEAIEEYRKQKGEELWAKLNREMRCLMIRRLKSDVQDTLKLPKKERIYVNADVGAEGERIYQAQEDNIRTLITLALRRRITKQIQKMVLGGVSLDDAIKEAEEYVKENVDIQNIEDTVIAVFGYLRRAAAEAKIPVATQWVKDFLQKEKKPLLIWGDHQKVINSMKLALDDIGVNYGVIDGASTKKARNETVKAFQNGDLDVVVLSKAGREGLTLTRASDALFVERWLVPTWEEQAEDRVYRIGQKEDVKIYYLMMKGTTDEDISNMIESKRNAIEKTVGLEDIQDSVGKEAKIEDQIIRDVAKKLREKISAELMQEPLTVDELIPTKKEIRASFTGEEFSSEFLKVFPKVNIAVPVIKKDKSPKRGAKLDVYEELRENQQYSHAAEVHPSSVLSALKSGGNIRVVNKKISGVDIADIKLSSSLETVVNMAKENDWEIPLIQASQITTKDQLKKFIKNGLGEIIKKKMKI